MTISANNDHNLRLWDWKAQELLGHGQGMKGIAPQVFGIIWNPWMVVPEDRDPAVPIFSEAPEGTEWMAYDFITVGANHVWFWRYEPGGPTHGANHDAWTPELRLPANPMILVKRDPMYGGNGTRQHVHHGAFLPTGHVLTANDDGSIGVWEKNQCIMEKPAHTAAIRVMRLRTDGTTLVTAGADGHVRVWTVTANKGFNMPFSLELLKDIDLVDPDAVAEGIPPQCFISLDVPEKMEDDTIVAADDNNDIWELSYLDDDPPRIMVEGQSGEVSGLATHPTISEVYATACTDGHVCLWDASERRNIKVMRIERGREEIEHAGKPMRTCKSEVTGRTTDYFYKDWRGRVPAKASDRTIKALKHGHKEGDHLQAWACAFSQQGDMLVVTTSGVVDKESHEDQGGCVIVYSVDEKLLTYSPDPSEKDYVPPKIWEAKIASTPIDCVAFSPCGRYLACGSHDTLIQILDVRRGFAGCGTCTGHSSTIRTLDWSDDSQILRSCSSDYELMYWNPRGKLIVGGAPY